MSKPRQYHGPRWDEPLLMQTGNPGERGIIPPEADPEVRQAVGDVLSRIPAGMRRQDPPRLPELSQYQVLRHYLRLSQMTLGMDLTPDISLGTCTMKYSPKVNELLARLPQMADLHPLQDAETLQGVLEIMYRMEQTLSEVSGMDAFTFQPGGGSQGIYTNAAIIRAYHESRGEGKQRTEIITSAFSHPADAAAPATAGFRIITLMPTEQGYPDVEQLKAVVSERTAGLMITSPEDTGLFNPQIAEFVRIVQEVGGLCAYDQANANGILGITRARDAGFDMCHFNLHKTFSSPHGSMGPGCGAVGVRQELARFLPVPVVAYDGRKYYLDHDRPDSIGKIRSFMGNVMVVMRAYAWAMAMGADGLRTVAETAVLNNNYLARKMAEIRGVTIPYLEGGRRLEQVRYSFESMHGETGVGTQDVRRRIVDYGMQMYHTSHHPVLVPEPCTLEPSESMSLADLDEYASVFRQVSDEAYSDPELVRTSPHRAPIHRIDESVGDDPGRWAMTWRAYLRKHRSEGA